MVLFFNLFTVYGTKNEGRVSGKGRDAEYIGTYYCGAHFKKGLSCEVQLKMFRFQDGLVAMKKCDPQDKKLIEHNKGAHRRHPESRKTNVSGGLSHEQKCYIVKHCGEMDPEALYTELTQEGSQISYTQEQEDNVEACVQSISNFSRNNKQFIIGNKKKKSGQ